MPFNVEFKARYTTINDAEKLLQNLQCRFAGTDWQVDTYFNVPYGRLKIREGNIENALIHYVRENASGSKSSQVLLYQIEPGSQLKNLLEAALGIKVIVDKQRKIFFADNVKIHLDTVTGLGSFIEVEAIDTDGTFTEDKLRLQCEEFAAFFGIEKHQFQTHSYSDMLLALLK